MPSRGQPLVPASINRESSMPTYEYACKKCGERFDVFQKFGARQLRTHKDCGGDLQKVFHARGVVFKGSGFYVTDNKSKASSSSTGDGATSDSSDRGGPDKKDTKLTTKPTTKKEVKSKAGSESESK